MTFPIACNRMYQSVEEKSRLSGTFTENRHMVRADEEAAAEHGLGAAYRGRNTKATTGAPVTVLDYR